ncbi:phosphate ABC transporter ATP-binding protein [Oceanobacillus arenosus]|uniref:Phosphate ABC transporter ATP-binding protein n=1 Tax=Oceanobacillus arenosus TaxID=1229153 RepID=A0A3D8PTK2_9BACI|nr:phosphate ABC transporter ATP-binding protein [Oceanobacillus arenosus]RDW19042.1 phosphate ABC transporter ATP-binding protein [Oceanobacillus arenosus]
MAEYYEAAIQFDHVNYSDRGTLILKDINGLFPKGKITTLVGPSGAGKTTLFKLCNRLISPNSGEIQIDGRKIDQYNPIELRQNVGLALQSATMIRGTVMKNLTLPLTLKGSELTEKDAKELLQDVGLDEEFLNRNVKDLSGGQRQKVSIARTLVNKPKILLLDEITSSLDRVSQQDIEALIVRINQKYGTTIVWITHNLTQAITIGEYSWVMIDGELIESGESSFLDNPQNDQVKQFIKGDLA